MSTYTYICKDKHETNIELPMVDETPSDIKCHKCGTKATRTYEKMTFILKGRGWASKPEIPNN